MPNTKAVRAFILGWLTSLLCLGALKLVEFIHWSWWLVLAPLWLPLTVVIYLAFVTFGACLLLLVVASLLSPRQPAHTTELPTIDETQSTH